MKKIFAFLMALILVLSFCSCGERELTPEEQLAEARKQTESLKKHADDAQKRLDDLNDAIDEYEYWKNQVDNAG
ncbi:MAG: hypothetical protein IJE28_06880 [Oscillospiraceae bacterium]|nr:hypothetical protein [Oscillospiraceae bacterium]MBQ3500829.1 hypothetical protein [Oscillospiraceae bacterium]